MAGSFCCPQCAKEYPLKPVLLGRPLRCSGCQGVILLSDEGEAFLIVEEEVAEQTQGVEAAGAPPEAERLLVEAQAIADAQRARTQRVSQQSQRLRRTISEQLQVAAQEAVESQDIRKSERLQRQSDRIARSETSPALERRRLRTSEHFAVLTGQGDRRGHDWGRWLLLGVASLVLLACAWWLLRPADGRVAALRAYSSPAPSAFPQRHEAFASRAWVRGFAGGLLPMISPLAPRRLGEVEGLDVAPLRTVMEEHLQGRVFLDDPAWWIAGDQVMAFRRDLEACATAVDREDMLRRWRPRAVDCVALGRALGEAGAGQRCIRVFAALLLGETGDGGRAWAALLQEGRLPDGMELCRFEGDGGQRLFVSGSGYEVRSCSGFSGWLLRVSGAGWPRDWRVLVVQEAGTMPLLPRALNVCRDAARMGVAGVP